MKETKLELKDMKMEQDPITYQYLKETIGIPLKTVLNEYNEVQGNEHHKIVFQIEDWNLEYFMEGLSFENSCLKYSGDYVSGRHMKTTIVYESGGQVTLETRNRGKGADRWMMQMQGKKHIQKLEYKN